MHSLILSQPYEAAFDRALAAVGAVPGCWIQWVDPDGSIEALLGPPGQGRDESILVTLQPVDDGRTAVEVSSRPTGGSTAAGPPTADPPGPEPGLGRSSVDAIVAGLLGTSPALP